jgi:hypothetical protein
MSAGGAKLAGLALDAGQHLRAMGPRGVDGLFQVAGLVSEFVAGPRMNRQASASADDLEIAHQRMRFTHECHRDLSRNT